MAISKERLKELIEQGATIYGIFRRKVRTIDLKDLYSISKNGKILVTEYIDLENFKIKDIFETKEEAEWYKEFGCIERVERLELPTWEEFNKSSSFIFTRKDGTEMEMAIWTRNTSVDKTIKITNLNDWNISWFEAPLTKENYLLACRKAKKLFLGEKV
jgi:hypothetical protein